MKKPRTLLLTGARKSLWTSGGVTGARLGAGPQQTKPMMAGMGSKKPRHWRAPGLLHSWVCLSSPGCRLPQVLRTGAVPANTLDAMGR